MIFFFGENKRLQYLVPHTIDTIKNCCCYVCWPLTVVDDDADDEVEEILSY